MPSTVRFHSRIPLVRAALHAALAAAVTETGTDIAEKTQENMYPGHFYDTGASHDQTAWEQGGELDGQIHVPTDYAAYPELGTVHMAPRPALTPAIAEVWPHAMVEHMREHGGLG